jgi:ankyrin repeat protein
MGRALTAVLLLFFCGCSPTFENQERQDPVRAAAIDCDTGALRRLARKASKSDKGEIHYSPLVWATLKGCKEGVAILLDAGADPNGTGEQTTPLAAAVGRGDTEIAELLLARGARMDGRGAIGQQGAIFAAAGSSRPEMIRWVIAHGDRATARDASGSTPLQYAGRCPECVRILLDAGADVNASDDRGHTPLMWARDESARLLLERGANLHAVSKEGRTALMLAASSGDPTTVRVLLEAGADVNARDEQGQTALDHAKVSRSWHRGFWPAVFWVLSKDYRAQRRAAAESEQILASARP